MVILFYCGGGQARKCPTLTAKQSGERNLLRGVQSRAVAHQHSQPFVQIGGGLYARVAMIRRAEDNDTHCPPDSKKEPAALTYRESSAVPRAQSPNGSCGTLRVIAVPPASFYGTSRTSAQTAAELPLKHGPLPSVESVMEVRFLIGTSIGSGW